MQILELDKKEISKVGNSIFLGSTTKQVIGLCVSRVPYSKISFLKFLVGFMKNRGNIISIYKDFQKLLKTVPENSKNYFWKSKNQAWLPEHVS